MLNFQIIGVVATTPTYDYIKLTHETDPTDDRDGTFQTSSRHWAAVRSGRESNPQPLHDEADVLTTTPLRPIPFALRYVII